MRLRAVLFVLAILLVAAFAALNWGEIVRPAPLAFGPFIVDAPPGAILLALLALATVAFVAAAAGMRTQLLLESRQHHKALEAQRELADKAEASRLTELRQHLDVQLRELGRREALAATDFERSVVQGQRELRLALEQVQRLLVGLEQRLDAQLGAAQRVPAAAAGGPRSEPVQVVGEPMADRYR